MKTNQKNKKHLFAVMRVLMLVGILVLVWDIYDAKWGFSQEIKRNAPGQGDYEEEMKLTSKRYTGEYKIQVEEQRLTREQVSELFLKARKEIDNSFLGENKTPDAVTDNLNLQKRYQDGMVRVRWSFDCDDCINNEGEIQQEKVTKATIVGVTAELQYGDYTDIYQFPIQVIPYKKTSEKGFLNSLSRELEKRNPEKEVLVLPQKIDGQKVVWRKKIPYRGMVVIGLGILGSWFIPYGERWEENRQRKKRQSEMVRDYPSIINQLSLLLGVGISLPEAVDRIVIRYGEKKKTMKMTLPGYELMSVMNREMKDGVGTLQAIENFGKNSDSKEYRKLAMLLQQNLRKGNAHIVDLLEREDVEAFERRKAMARKLGEEASTKLLIPMIGMLGLVIVILVVPALLTLGA